MPSLVCISLNTTNCHDSALWCLFTAERDRTSLSYFYAASLFWTSSGVQMHIQTCSDLNVSLWQSYWSSKKRQAGMYGSTDITFLYLLSLCYPRNKVIWIWNMRKKCQSSVKENLCTGFCILQKIISEQIGIKKPVKSERLITSSSNPRGFTEIWGRLLDFCVGTKLVSRLGRLVSLHRWTILGNALFTLLLAAWKPHW